MKLIYLYLAIITSLLLSLQEHALAQGTDRVKAKPGTIYVTGYSAINKAEKLEASGKYKEAWNKYHQALRYYKTISINYPDWKKLLVANRLETTKASIKRVEPLAQKEHVQKQNKYNKYLESNTSENGIPSPNKEIIPNPNSKKQTYQLNLNNKQRKLKLQLDKERREHKRKITQQEKKISELRDKLRRATHGLNKENSQTKLLNDQINKLSQSLKSSERLSRASQQKTIDTIARLTRERTKIATAPLKLDIENLKQKKQQFEDELKSLVVIHKELVIKSKRIADERNKLTEKLKFAQAAYKQQTDRLALAKKNGHKVMTALRDQIKAQDAEIKSLTANVNALKVENQGLITQLTTANAINAELSKDLASVTIERDQLKEYLALNDSDRTKKTIREALRLGEELRNAQDAIKQLQQDQNASQDRIIKAENKLVVAKKKIIDLQNENTNYIRRIGALEDDLRNTQEQLSNKLAKNKSPLQIEEVKTLKTIINRITTQLERRKQAEKILIAEYQKTNVSNLKLNDAIVSLTSNNIKLTAKENKILNNQINTDSFSINSGRSKSPEARRAAKAKSRSQIQSLESLARRCVEKGSLQTAKDIFDEAYDAHGHHYPFFINRGVVRVQMNEFQEAEEIFESAAQLRQNNAYTHFMLGFCRFKNNKDILAKKSLEAAIHIRPDYTEPYIYLAFIAHDSGNNKKAKEHLLKAVRVAPEHKEALFNLSRIHHQLGEKQEAIDTYNNALKAGLPPNLDYEKQIGIFKSISTNN